MSQSPAKLWVTAFQCRNRKPLTLVDLPARKLLARRKRLGLLLGSGQLMHCKYSDIIKRFRAVKQTSTSEGPFCVC